MCEPAFSISQFEDPDQFGNAPSSHLGMKLGVIAQLGKRIRSWFHLSKMGYGHHESTAKILGGRISLPSHTKYETMWWSRDTKVDGYHHGKLSPEDALDACDWYAHQTCIGGLPQLRTFLERTLMGTDRLGSYIPPLQLLFGTRKGKRAIDRFYHQHRKDLAKLIIVEPTPRQLTNFVVGMTRHREMMCPEWADDNKLWLPSTEKEIVNV